MNQIAEKAYKELYDPQTIKNQLLQLEQLYKLEEISEEEYQEISEKPWDRLSHGP
ncbi:MAG: Gas vesicle protein [Clostridia bacterium]|nr:Gas vesicle protein [Clostridia bacterium]